MKRPRFTVRWMMVLVAIVGFGMAGTIWGQKIRKQQQIYRLKAGLARVVAFSYDPLLRWEKPSSEEYARIQAGEEYHRRMAAKYERAARYPWLPVEPDPADPTVKYHRRMAAKYDRTSRYPWVPDEPDAPAPGESP